MKPGYSGPRPPDSQVPSCSSDIYSKLKALELTNIDSTSFGQVRGLTSIRLVRSRGREGSTVPIKSFFELLSNNPGLQSLALVRYSLATNHKAPKGPPIPLHSLTRVCFISTDGRPVPAYIDAPAIDSLVVDGMVSGSLASLPNPILHRHLSTDKFGVFNNHGRLRSFHAGI
jgi:hypothetical protein